MNEYTKSNYMGMSSHLNDASECSASARMQQHYWTTKQAVFRKLGKKEDDCIIASDYELDLKLELYQTIEESFLALMRVLEVYQEKLCVLAQEENALGRFLKENGKQDKTRAGRAMSNAGKALSYSAQQRLTLRIPLVRLYQEVETFQYRAIVDTLQTVEKMEKARTAYRGSLLWMKDISQQLDPDTCKQMDKFRKVQNQVRKAKQRFDKMKLDTLQKVDLLSFSRCNLFSQALASYQNALLNVSRKIAHTSNTVVATTKGYQHYEFSTLKELTETSKKLAEGVSDSKYLPDDDSDTLLFFEAEYHDDLDVKNSMSKSDNIHDDPEAPDESSFSKPNEIEEKISTQATEENTVHDQLLHLNDGSHHAPQVDDSSHILNKDDQNATVANELLFLDELLSSTLEHDSASIDKNLLSEWQDVFESPSRNTVQQSACETQENIQNSVFSFLPSQLLMTNSDFLKTVESNTKDASLDNKDIHSECASKEPNLKGKMKAKQDMSAWFNLFADLDPLANPDMIGDKKETHDDRNC